MTVRRASDRKPPDIWKLGDSDLRIERSDGSKYSYVLKETSGGVSSLVYDKTTPNVPLNIGMATPANPTGGAFDVLDQSGEKRVATFDWSEGEGQESLDTPDASPSRYWRGECLDIRNKGKLSVCRKLDFHQIQNATGPVLFAHGYYWMVCDIGVSYSADGETWTACTINTPSNGRITDIISAGDTVYFCVPSGDDGDDPASPQVGVWECNMSTFEFTKVATDACTHLAYSSGMMWGATLTGCGYFDNPPTTLTDTTPVYLTDLETIALVPSNNGVYWLARDGEYSYVYQITYDVDAATEIFTQFAEFRSGFIVTCGCFYLGTLYVGGYLSNPESDIGRGMVYICTSGEVVPLTSLGPDPEQHPELTAPELDNKVLSIVAAGEKIYIQTTRRIFLWDIDDGGYHCRYQFYYPGVGAVAGGTTDDSFDGISFDYESFCASPAFYESPDSGFMCIAEGVESLFYEYGDSSHTIDVVSEFEDQLTVDEDYALTAGERIIVNSSSDATLVGTWYVNGISTDYITLRDFLGVLKHIVVGTTANITFNLSRGIAFRSPSYYHDGGWIESSQTNFHTGSMRKNFRNIIISHVALLEWESLAVEVFIDQGTAVNLERDESKSTDTLSVFPINMSGTAIRWKVYLNAVSLGVKVKPETTPQIISINVVWDFEKVGKSRYILDCREGAANGRWDVNVQDAVTHLFSAANEECTVVDKYRGEYTGTIDEIQFEPTNRSVEEGLGGFVTLVIREIE